MKTDNTKRRDWSLIIFILPIGILLMLLAGQLAIRMAPNWLIDGEINSNLDPETASKQQALIVRPVSNGILTPMSWWDTFLTPGADDGSGVSYPPFVIFVPTSTPTQKPTSTPNATATSVTPTSTASQTATPTPTKKPPVGTDTPSPTATSTNTATSTTTVTTTATTTVTPTTTATTTSTVTATTTSTSTATITPVPTGYPSTPVGTQVVVPPGLDTSAPDGVVGSINDGEFVVLTLTAPIVVTNPSEKNYDLIYYEQLNVATGKVGIDSVILSISSDGNIYYVVFNWGNGVPDNNSNVGSVAGTEADNQDVDPSILYGTPPVQTGILIDVDNAPSSPPPGTYTYLAIQAPVAPSVDSGVDVDSVVVTEVAPTP